MVIQSLLEKTNTRLGISTKKKGVLETLVSSAAVPEIRPSFKIKTSTPQTTERGTLDDLKTAGKFLFSPKGEIRIRPIGFTEEQAAELPSIKGPRIITGPAKLLYDVTADTLRLAARGVTDVVGSVIKHKAIEIPKSLQAILKGFDIPVDPDGFVQTVGDRTLARAEELDKESPGTPKLNTFKAFAFETLPPVLGVFFAGDIASIAARTLLKATASSPILGISSQTLRNRTPAEVAEILGDRFKTEIGALDLSTQAGRSKAGVIVRDTRRLGQAFSQETIPQLNRLGQFLDDMALRLEQDVTKLRTTTRPLGPARDVEAERTLPGFKRAEGEPEFSFGLRVERQEPVGFGPEKSNNIRTGEEIVEYVTRLGEDPVNPIIDVIRKQNFRLQRLTIKEVLEGDPHTAMVIQSELSEPFSTKNVDSPIVIGKDKNIIDGEHRLQAKLKAGDDTIDAYVGISAETKVSPQEEFLADLDRTRAEAPAAKVEPVAKAEEVSLEFLEKQKEEVLSGEQIDAVMRDITRGIDPKKPRFQEEEIQSIRSSLEFMREAVESHPARSLQKFVSPKTGKLPEVAFGAKSQFGKRGDDIVTEKGFVDVREAEASLAEFRDLKKRFDEAMEEFSINVKKAGTVEELLNAKERLEAITEIIKQKSKTAEVQVLKNTINKELSRTLPRVEGGIKKGQLDPQSQKKIDQYRKIMTTRDRAKAMTRIEENKAQYTDDEGLLTGMPDSIAIENEMLQAAGLFMPKAFGTKISNARDIGKEGLERILENLRSIKETGKTKREIQRFNFQTEVQRVEEKLKDNALAGKELDLTVDASPVEETVIKKYIDKWNKYRDGHLNADFWAVKAQSFSGDTTRIEGPFVDAVKRIHKARQGYIKDTLEAEKDIMETFYKAYDLKTTGAANKKMREMQKRIDLGKFKLRNGKDKTIKLNRSEMIAKWMQMQQTHTKIRLKQGNQWTDEIMAAVTSKLTAEDKSVGRFLIDKFYPEFAKKAAPIYEDLTGLYMVRVKNYSPSPTKTADIIPEHVKIAQQEARASLKPSSIKQRTDLVNLSPEAEVAPLEFDDPFITALTHATQMNRFIHFSEPIFFWRNLLKTGGQLRKALTQQFGREFPQQMERLLDDVARGRIKDVQNLQWLNTLTGNAATSILSLNITQTPKQLVSSLMWALEESPKELAKWMPHYLKNARSVVAEIYDNSPFMRARGKKKSFDRDAKFHQESKDMRNLVTGKQTFTEKGMLFVQFGDRGGILSFGGAFYLSRKAKYRAQGFSEKEVIQKAIDDFEQAAKRIQQDGELESIGMFQRSGGLARPVTLFQGTPLQFLRWEEHLIRSLGLFERAGGPKAKGKKLDTLAKILLIHFNFMLFQIISDGVEVRKERDVRAFIFGPAGSFFILGSAFETTVRIIVGDDVFDKGTEITGLTRMSDVFFDIPKTWKRASMDVSFENVLDAGRATIEALLNIKGIPASNVTNLIESSFDFATQKESDPRTIIYSDYALDKNRRKKTPTSPSDTSTLRIRKPELRIPKLKLNIPSLKSGRAKISI